jgi:predicted DNA-binding protein (MmcQ/YjbR family)
LAKLRKICLQWPETAEALKWGHPTFVAGKKLFAAFGEHDDRLVVGFWLPPELWDQLVDDVHMIPAPYGARYGWVNLFLDQQVNWKQLETYLLVSYKHVALKRMIAQLDTN